MPHSAISEGEPAMMNTHDDESGLSPPEKSGQEDAGAGLPGIVRELGELGSGAVITESGLAKLMRRHPVSIKRAVERGELPPPIRLLGGPAWTVGVIVRHLEARLEQAAKEAERIARKISQLSP
jgi:hypothetical protein